MSPALSRGTLRRLSELFDRYVPLNAFTEDVRRALLSASKERKPSQAKPTKQRKKSDRTERRAEVRRLVMERAKGHCECCGISDALELDHFFGRARSESVPTCWALCPGCHRAKTLNRPDAAFWYQAFSYHCEPHGYQDAANMARNRLAFVEARSQLGERLKEGA